MKQPIHKKDYTYITGLAAVMCHKFTVEGKYADWDWDKVTCEHCLKKKPAP